MWIGRNGVHSVGGTGDVPCLVALSDPTEHASLVLYLDVDRIRAIATSILLPSHSLPLSNTSVLVRDSHGSGSLHASGRPIHRIVHHTAFLN